MKELVYQTLTNEPILQSDLIKLLNKQGCKVLNSRTLRNYINQLNKEFIDGKRDAVIISNKNGTYKSTNDEDIRKFNKAKIKHAKSELWSAYHVNKRLNDQQNIDLFEFIEREMKDE